MANGFRDQRQPGRKEKIRGLDVELKNTAMSVRINQMMTQQIMQNLKGMHEDVSRALNLISEMQYKILAIQKVGGFDVTTMNQIANEQRLQDFCEASDREDAEKGFTHGDVVNEQSTVIVTSTTEGTDQGIFRSRLKLSESGVPDLITAFMGSSVGAKAKINLNGVNHEVELLAIRQPAPAAAEDADETPQVSN